MLEEFYGIALRKKKNRNDVFWTNSLFEFDEIRFNISSRYWVADPFIVEDNDKVYVFYELYDYFKGKGVIAYSLVEQNRASTPNIIIEEKVHLSFPFIWKDGENYYIMPESSGDSNLVVYVASEFPVKWIKHSILLNDVKLCDSVRFDTLKRNETYIISSSMDTQKEYYWCDVTNKLYKDENGKPRFIKDLSSGSIGIRNAGAILRLDDNLYRPGQVSDHNNYGHGLSIWRLTPDLSDDECVYSFVSEEAIGHFNTESITADKIVGIHTYNSSEKFEVVDFKYYRSFSFAEKIRNIIG